MLRHYGASIELSDVGTNEGRLISMWFDFFLENKDIIGFAIAVFAGMSAVIRWLDTRNRELRESRYQTYMDLVGVVSGKRTDSTTPNITEQIAAVWFLVEYEEYYDKTQKIFSFSDFRSMASEPWVQHVLPHVEKMLAEIVS